MPRPALKMLCRGTEGNQSDIANPRQNSLVQNTRGPALPRNDQNFHLPKFKNSLVLLILEGGTTFTRLIPVLAENEIRQNRERLAVKCQFEFRVTTLGFEIDFDRTMKSKS